MTPLMRGQKVLERMGAELRMASEWGEDRDKDGELDPGEDTNGNGVLDADWSLADGVCEKTLSFNRRIDLRDEYGTVIATGLHSRRITYRLVEDKVIRQWQVTKPGGSVATRTAVMARGIKDVQFCRQGPLIQATVEVRLSKEVSHTFTTRTRLRN